MRARLVAGICIALSGALVAGSYLFDSRDEVIPWRNVPITEASLGPPSPLPRPIPDGARTCRGRDVAVQVVSSGPLNSLTSVYGLELRNTSTETCVVRSRSHATVLNGDRSIRITYGRKQKPFALWPGGRVGIDLFASKCFEPPWVPPRWAPIRLSYLSRATTLRMRACARGRATLVVPPFVPPPPPETRRERFPLAATTHVPEQARAGETMRLLVELQNTSSKPFRFPYCPVQEFGVMGGGRFVSSLNCHPTGEIAPGGSATFELRAPMRPDAPPGRAEVYWHMEDGTFTGDIFARDAVELR